MSRTRSETTMTCQNEGVQKSGENGKMDQKFLQYFIKKSSKT